MEVASISSLTDHIERYIKALLDQAGQGGLEIRRTELAELFECVPSQINYVLKTRFSSMDISAPARVAERGLRTHSPISTDIPVILDTSKKFRTMVMRLPAITPTI